jgi:integrase
MALTDAAIQRALRDAAKGGKPKTLTDDGRRGEGRLIAMIRPMPSGSIAEFYARQIRDGRARTAKLGTYPGMPLADARAAFKRLAPSIREGEHVKATRDKVRTERHTLGTLMEVCLGYVASMTGRRSGPEIFRVLVKAPDAACTVIGGHRTACDITPTDVAEWLRPMHIRAPASANQARRWLSAAFTWAMKRENDYTIAQPHKWGLTTNPAMLVPAHTIAQRGGTRHLSRDEFRAVWYWLASEGGRSDMRACNAMRIMMATGQRVEEITGLTAGQYANGWIRWADTKVGRITGQAAEHSIPVPEPAIKILDGMTPNKHGLYVPGFKVDKSPYPFKSFGWIARRCAKQLGIPQFTPRDLRRTWRTLADDANLTGEECARIMNHAWGSRIEAVHYDRSGYASAKIAGMAKWERWLSATIAPSTSPDQTRTSYGDRQPAV